MTARSAPVVAQASAGGGWRAVLLGVDGRVRTRVLQFAIASAVYVGSSLGLVLGVAQGWITAAHVGGWVAFVGGATLLNYGLLRSGYSERFADPSLSAWQLSVGVTAALWGYAIGGSMRAAALYPLMVIFAFGAFTLRARQIALLTVYALGGLAVLMLLQAPPGATATVGQTAFNTWWMLAIALSGLAIVAARLSGLRARLRQQREALGRALADVERLAAGDELTGLPNRRSMTQHLDRLQALAPLPGTTCLVALLDIDCFKSINDTLGHEAGDTVLRNFARLARAQLRDTDVLGRWGGEEFLLVAQGRSGRDGVERALERIRIAVRHEAHPHSTVTFSAGIAVLEAGDTAAAALARADRALYAAKADGRDCVRRAE